VGFGGFSLHLRKAMGFRESTNSALRISKNFLSLSSFLPRSRWGLGKMRIALFLPALE
jgi:hypothetical protein